MNKYTLRYLSVGMISFFNSLFPIFSWQIIGAVFGDNTLINCFNATFSFQYLFLMLLVAFVSGNLIYDTKNNTKRNYTYSGLLIGALISILIAVILTLNIDSYMIFLNLDNKYLYFIIYAVWNLSLNLILLEILELCYYDNKDKLAFKYSFIFNVIGLLILVICKIININIKYSIIFALLGLSVYLSYLLIKHIEKFEFKINILKGFNFVSVPFISNVMMFITYFICMHHIFNTSAVFVFASSVASMCVNAQWNMINSSIPTVTRIETIRDNSHEHLKVVSKSASLFLWIIIGSSWFLGIVLWFIYKPSFVVLALILFFETFDIWLYKYFYVRLAWLNVEHNNKWLVICAILQKIIRLFFSLVILSPYALWIGQLVGGIWDLITINVIYRHYKKQENNNMEKS